MSAGKFFSIRYSLNADDMGGYALDFTCETPDFSKCYKTVSNKNSLGDDIQESVKPIAPHEAKTIYDEFIALDVFNLKSVESRPLGEHVGVRLGIYSSMVFSIVSISVEVSDDKRLNRFSIVPGKHKDERYIKIFKIFKDHGFLPEESKKSTSNGTDTKAIEKIQTFYSKHIFGNEFANDSVIATYCTKSLAQKLSKAYDNEFSDGGGYAVWKFRSSAQDGPDIQEVEKIEPLGDGKYLVHYNDMGNKGTHTITTVNQDGEIFFDKLD
ncbi:hypothetical protein [Fibrobacter sp. UWB12]|uniref:hypothetical protein n=1 Tax=Fibrobacter sp. UWB12 TaxID=1896203 RepID=UPI0020C9036E|nr:hypothetical protein [Fibrobacter sp. UWB12]